MSFVYQPKTVEQLRRNFNKRVRNNENGFVDFNDFLDWYRNQELVCSYCGLTEVESQRIAITGILTSNRFPQNGIVGRGTSRGAWLEVDRNDPQGVYSRDNSTLACYFCNNDKSDLLNSHQYLDFFQNRVAFLRRLIQQDDVNQQNPNNGAIQ